MLPLKNKTIKIAFITIRFPLEQFLNDNAILGSSIYALGPTPPADAFEYTKILGEAYQKLALPEIPSMPILAKPNAGGTSSRKAPDLIIASKISGGKPFNAEHQDNVADKGFVSESWMAMVFRQR